MNKILTVIQLILFSFTTILAQNTADLFIENPTVNVSQTKFSFEIHITPTNDWGSNTGDKSLGDCSWYFNYNSSALANPVITFVGSAVVSTHYVNSTGISGGQLYVDTKKINSLDPGVPLTQNTKYHTYTVEMDIIDNSMQSNLTWDHTNTGIFSATGNSVNESYNGTGDILLPVELISFSALVNSDNVNLNWKTATEVNNNGFEVQREVRNQNSEAGSQWEKIGFVHGHGNSNSPKEYSFTDKNLTGGTNFVYRLKQIDNDGQYQYSKEVEVKVVPKDINLLQNYPNPFNPVTEIKFTLPEAARVTLRVYNIIGQEVASLLNGIEEAGFHSAKFEGSNLPSGTYIYRLQTGSVVQTKKMLLLK